MSRAATSNIFGLVKEGPVGCHKLGKDVVEFTCLCWFLKRHSDGTFTSDFTHYLDKIKAKDFVEWLTDPKQEG
uniref:Glucagon / GIP / secretin / VIP family domain-containing protein n=1 Tax=Maylandia zebra TaxID=106582 RepID=A0A3P9ARI5_9CICH